MQFSRSTLGARVSLSNSAVKTRTILVEFVTRTFYFMARQRGQQLKLKGIASTPIATKIGAGRIDKVVAILFPLFIMQKAKTPPPELEKSWTKSMKRRAGIRMDVPSRKVVKMIASHSDPSFSALHYIVVFQLDGSW